MTERRRLIFLAFGTAFATLAVMPRTLGIDIGTTSVSLVLLDTGNPSATRHASVNTGAFRAEAPGGHREQDCSRIVRGLSDTLSQLAGRNGRLSADAISVTGQMHSCVFLDAARRPATPLITWQDKRPLETAPGGGTWLDEFLRILRAHTTEPLGMNPTTGYMGATWFAMSRAGTLPHEARGVAMVHDWIVSEMIGDASQPLVTDPSFAQSAGLFLPSTSDWNQPAIRALGLDPNFLPRVQPMASRIGVTGRTAFPLVSGIPIFAGAGDNQASVLGSLRELRDSVLINLGTGGQVSVVSDQFGPFDGIDTRMFADGLFLLVGPSFCGGRAYAILKNFLSGIGRDVFGVSLDDAALYAALERLARDTTPMTCEPLFAGTPSEPSRRGVIGNVSEENFTLGDLATAVMTGIVEELRGYHARMPGSQHHLVGAGNAFRRNTRLRHVAARVFNRTLHLPSIAEEAALGAALLSAVGLGVFPNAGAAGRAIVRFTE